MEKKLTSWLTDNEVKTRQFCKDLLSQLKRRHLDPVFQQLQERGAAKVSFDDIISGYQRIKDEYNESAIGAKDVIAKVFVELHAVRHFYILANYVFLCSGERFFYKLIWHSKQSFAKLMLWLVFLFHYVQFV